MIPNHAILMFSGAILALSSITDIAKHRIPNAASLGGAALLLILHTYWNGWDGLLLGVGGWFAGLLLFMPFYVAGGMAAGDVKLMAAAGAAVGPKLAALCVGASLVAGMLLAIMMILSKGGAVFTFRRYGMMVKTFLRTRKFVYIKPAEGDVARLAFPYAVAILLGTGAVVWWHTGTMFGIS